MEARVVSATHIFQTIDMAKRGYEVAVADSPTVAHPGQVYRSNTSIRQSPPGFARPRLRNSHVEVIRVVTAVLRMSRHATDLAASLRRCPRI
jgi:hypothetical protein